MLHQRGVSVVATAMALGGNALVESGALQIQRCLKDLKSVQNLSGTVIKVKESLIQDGVGLVRALNSGDGTTVSAVSGACGQVVKGICNGVPCVVKLFRSSFPEEGMEIGIEEGMEIAKTECRDEVDMYWRLSTMLSENPQLSRYFSLPINPDFKKNRANMCKSGDSSWPHIRFASGDASLSEHLSTRSANLVEDDLINFCVNVAEAVHLMHVGKLVHGDLKLANVIYNTTQNVAKLIDFGLSRLDTEDKENIYKGETGGYKHWAPEYNTKSKVEPLPADVFGLGYTMEEIFEEAKKGMPFELRELVARMKSKQPEDRPQMEKVVTELKAVGALKAFRAHVNDMGGDEVAKAWQTHVACNKDDILPQYNKDEAKGGGTTFLERTFLHLADGPREALLKLLGRICPVCTVLKKAAALNCELGCPPRTVKEIVVKKKK